MVRERAEEECRTMGEAYDEGYQQGRADAIDEFYNRLLVNKKDINLANYPWNYIELVAREMTKQLKEQNNEQMY